MKKKYDDTDLAILREVREYSREAHRKLAQRLGIHPNTLIQRIKKLEQDKVIMKYSTDIDYRKIGYDIHAFILAKVKKGIVGRENQLNDLIKVPEVQSVYAVTGGYDVAILLRAKDRDDLTRLMAMINENAIITKTNTSLILYTYKQPYDFNPLA